MRVLIVTNMYPTPEMPSFGTFVQDQVIALRDLGVECDVFFFKGRANRWAYLWAFPRFWRQLRRGRYDLIHAHYVLAGIVARAQWGHRLVLTHHGGEVLGQPRGQAPICRLLTPLCDETITVTEQMRRVLRADDAWVIPCGVDLGRFAPRARQGPRRLGSTADQTPRPLRRRILATGETIRPRRGSDGPGAARPTGCRAGLADR